MKKTIWKCALAGGLILFVWGFISWMVLPWHQMSYNSFKDEKQVQQVIKNNANGEGIYILPHCCNKDAKELSALRKEGPTMFACVRMTGYHMGAKPVVISLITQILGAALIAWMLMQLKTKEYKSKVLFVTAAGFFVGLMGVVPSWNWWGFPLGYTVVMWLDLIIGWFLAGLAMASLVRKK
jgi:hypothetical protein